MTAELTDRLRREIEHSSKDIALRQAEAGWDSPAGRVRRDRRATFLLNQIPRSARILEIGAGTGITPSPRLIQCASGPASTERRLPFAGS
jgi:hypothetical protein